MQLTPEIIFRQSASEDTDAVCQLLEAAFGNSEEAALVRGLPTSQEIVSLVAASASDLVGYILFTPVLLGTLPLKIAALGPMAVAPSRQRSGIGSMLVKDGLAALQEAGFGAVVVLGHPGYYLRFGFTPASGFGLSCRWPVPDDVFMARELAPGYLKGVGGKVEYVEAFDVF